MLAQEFPFFFIPFSGAIVTRSELISKLAEKNPALYRRDVEKLVSIIFDEIANALQRGDRVELRGFGSFSVRTRNARNGHNPRTGERVAVAKRNLPHFKMGKGMFIRLNK